MTYDELKNFIKQHLKEKYQTFIKKYPTEYNAIVGYTSFLPKTSTLRERQYCIINNILSTLLCPTCSLPLPWSPQKGKYQKYCCRDCRDGREIKQKMTQTMLEKYGVEHPIQNRKVREKTKQTNLKRYGTEWNIQSLGQRKRMEEKREEKYGTKYPLQTKAIQQKLKQTMLERYGVEHPSHKLLDTENLFLLNDKKWLETQHKNIPLYKIAELLNVDPTTIGNYFKKHNLNVHGWTFSTGETELKQFIETFKVKVISNTRSTIPPHELDIYIPEKQIAIEYCGLYWHSEQKGKGRTYHRNKLIKCNEKGIRLLTIFEDEWKFKRHIIKQKIKSILDKDDRQIVYARKTFPVNVSTTTKKQFLEETHIQGNGPGSITYGLMYKNELVALMTFIKQKNNHYILNRYSTSCRVVGGFSKLLKHFQRNHIWKEIVSFADLRWSEGNLYEKTGFSLDKQIPPDYYYIVNERRIHKFNFRHKNLPNILKVYNPKLSEKQNTDINNIYRIWNCGLQRYSLKNIEQDIFEVGELLQRKKQMMGQR